MNPFVPSIAHIPLVSATWPDSVRKLAASFQRDPVRVTVGSDDLTANSRVEQVLEVFDDTRSKKYAISFVFASSALTRNAVAASLVTFGSHFHETLPNHQKKTTEFSSLSCTKLRLHE